MPEKQTVVPQHGRSHGESHRGGREGWLRAAVLGADDGVVSTASLLIGLAAASAPNATVLLAGLAGLVAGAMSMAAGEYVSVSSQRDAQEADIAVEKHELADNPHAELRELAMIYEKRGLDPELARRVAAQLTEHGQLEAHVRDELGVTERTRARPVQAALVSAGSFGLMSLIPVASLLLAPRNYRILAIATCALASLGALGALGGHLAGAPRGRAAIRVLVGGGLAMATSALIGRLLGVAGV
jgi:VIT1/CCC1 family predicted Fe2+/Mn2+ transporter